MTIQSHFEDFEHPRLSGSLPEDHGSALWSPWIIEYVVKANEFLAERPSEAAIAFGVLSSVSQ
jgi:hypothetical protein